VFKSRSEFCFHLLLIQELIFRPKIKEMVKKTFPIKCFSYEAREKKKKIKYIYFIRTSVLKKTKFF